MWLCKKHLTRVRRTKAQVTKPIHFLLSISVGSDSPKQFYVGRKMGRNSIMHKLRMVRIINLPIAIVLGWGHRTRNWFYTPPDRCADATTSPTAKWCVWYHRMSGGPTADPDYKPTLRIYYPVQHYRNKPARLHPNLNKFNTFYLTRVHFINIQ